MKRTNEFSDVWTPPAPLNDTEWTVVQKRDPLIENIAFGVFVGAIFLTGFVVGRILKRVAA